jgi:hypothetical protein
MPAKTITGARALVYVNNKLVGIFESCTVANTTSTEAIHLLGRYTPAEIAITAKEAVNVTCSGFRVAGNGKTVLPAMPKVQDLLNFEPFTIAVVDRQSAGPNPVPLETIIGCVPTSDNTNYNAKATSRVNISYIGIISSDEAGAQSESGVVPDLTPPSSST